MTKGKFYLCTGIGHCGTQWLANALHHPERGVSAAHEGIRWWCPRSLSLGSWKDSTLYYLEHGIDQRFDCYFAKLDELLSQYRIVVDTHSWIPSAVPEVAKRVEVSGIIHLHHLFESPRGSEWTHWCAWWAANATTVNWLREQGLDVEMYRLEDLATPTFATDIFTLLTSWLGFELSYGEIKSRRAIDWNRHIMGGRTPIRLLAGWNTQQRETFLALCGEIMYDLGYF